MSNKELRFVCSAKPGPDGCRFIEVENESGVSVRAGEWRDRPDGLAELVVPMPHPFSDEFMDRLEAYLPNAENYVGEQHDLLGPDGSVIGKFDVALVKPGRQTPSQRVAQLEQALRDIAAETYDEFTNGAKAKHLALNVLGVNHAG